MIIKTYTWHFDTKYIPEDPDPTFFSIHVTNRYAMTDQPGFSAFVGTRFAV